MKSPTQKTDEAAFLNDRLLYKQGLQRVMKEREQSLTSSRSWSDLGAALLNPLEWRDDQEPQVNTTQPQHSADSSKASSTMSMVHCSLGDDDEVQLQVTDDPNGDAGPRLLSDSQLEQLHQTLPESLQMHQWERCLATGRDGDAFCTLLHRCAAYEHTVVVVQTTRDKVLGGFASERWSVASTTNQRQYYGNGRAFLFASHPEGAQVDATLDDAETAPLHIYRWTGRNDYSQLCDTESKLLAMGGVGDFALLLMDSFARGRTGNSATFDNPPLVSGGEFDIQALEVYGLVPLFQCFAPSRSVTSLAR